MTNKIIFSTQYFAGIEFYLISNIYSSVYIEYNEHYQKRSKRNRTIILGPNGPLSLSVPLSKGKNEQSPIHQVRINYNTNWITQHLETIASCYGNAPYYIYYIDEIKEILNQRHTFLWELNSTIDKFIRTTIAIEKIPTLTTDYVKQCQFDFRNTKSTNYKRMQEKVFVNMNYNQVFEAKYGYVPYLSILDLLFCVGPESIYHLHTNKIEL